MSYPQARPFAAGAVSRAPAAVWSGGLAPYCELLGKRICQKVELVAVGLVVLPASGTGHCKGRQQRFRRERPGGG